MRVILSVCLFSCLVIAQKVPGFDISAIDRKADPCGDFYQYACGAWMAANPIPPDQSTWGRFSELNERNKVILREILEKASTQTANRSATDQKIGDFYAACMDEQEINARGTAPLKPWLDDFPAQWDPKLGIHVT